MLKIELNRANYEYDINSLVRAFYPGQSVMILTPDSTDKRKAKTEELFKECVQRGENVLQMDIALDEGGAGVSIDGESFRWNYENEGETARTAMGVPLRTYKREFVRFFYGILKRHTGKGLPWGSLIGIRPTKIACKMLEQGASDKEILDTFTGIYEADIEKAELGLEIAKREREILKDVHRVGGADSGYSLYIGIPFCPTTCLYCSFTSYPIAGYKNMVDAYLDSLILEMEFVAREMDGKILDSVYIGGGTPTTLTYEQLDRLICMLKDNFNFDTVREFTVEAGRADSITKEKLEVLKRHNVGRISINPQTMNQKTLDIIGRKASVGQVVEAYKLAREAGFDNINMDLILGLPGESEEDVQRTIDSVVELEPDSLTVHSLAIKRASALSGWVLENGVKTLCNTDETMRIARDGARKMGMKPYYLYRQKNMSGNFENVGYAKPGKYGLYNILIMEEVQTIMALGAGSITKRVYPDGRIERCDNVKEVAAYIERLKEMLERKRVLLN